MSSFRSQVLNYFDRNWFPYALGFNGVATIVSFLVEHGIVLISLVCTAIAPVILKLIATLREGKRDKELLRHETEMHKLAELKMRIEISALEDFQKVHTNSKSANSNTNNSTNNLT